MVHALRSRCAPATRPRRSLRRGVALAVALTVALAATGGADASAAKRRPKVKAKLTISLGERSAPSAGPDATISDEQAQQVLNTLKQYVQLASVTPIRKNQPAADLSGVFGAAVAPRVAGPDRPVLVDEGLPKPKGRVVASAAPLTLVGLGDQKGAVILIAAALDLNISAKVTKKGPKMLIHRTGSLILEPDGAAWKITGYDIAVTRSGGGVDTTTTSTTTSTTVKTR